MAGEGKPGIHERRALRVVVNEHVLEGGEGRGGEGRDGEREGRRGEGRGGEGRGGEGRGETERGRGKASSFQMSLNSHFAGGRFYPLLPAIWKVAVGHGKAVDDLYQL